MSAMRIAPISSEMARNLAKSMCAAPSSRKESYQSKHFYSHHNELYYLKNSD